jgi:hypothetical protein
MGKYLFSRIRHDFTEDHVLKISNCELLFAGIQLIGFKRFEKVGIPMLEIFDGPKIISYAVLKSRSSALTIPHWESISAWISGAQ